MKDFNIAMRLLLIVSILVLILMTAMLSHVLNEKLRHCWQNTEYVLIITSFLFITKTAYFLLIGSGLLFVISDKKNS